MLTKYAIFITYSNREDNNEFIKQFEEMLYGSPDIEKESIIKTTYDLGHGTSHEVGLLIKFEANDKAFGSIEAFITDRDLVRSDGLDLRTQLINIYMASKYDNHEPGMKMFIDRGRQNELRPYYIKFMDLIYSYTNSEERYRGDLTIDEIIQHGCVDVKYIGLN